jgi:tRNA pseudouridine-54 N-methylase
VKDESIKEMNASKRACKAVEKNLDLAVRKHLQNPTAVSDREIERLERALAEASILFTLKKDAADEAAAEWEAVDALLATLLSQPSQEEIDDKDELDEEEYDEELELDEYIEDFGPLDSVEGVI